jgi:hypothetical protein
VRHAGRRACPPSPAGFAFSGQAVLLGGVPSHVAHDYDDPSAAPRPCQNCGAPLRGPYCARCGQHDIDYHRSFRHLAHDLLENLFHFDGKILVTVAWLLAKPGRLTAEFNAGRRQSQVPPLRLYIFVTVLFFLGVHLLNHGHLIDYDRHETDQVTSRVQQLLKSEDPLIASLTLTQRQEVNRMVTAIATANTVQLDDAAIKEIVLRVRNGEHQKFKGVSVTFDRGSRLGRALSDKIASGELTLSTILDELERRVPTLLFLGMPVFALLLRIFYVRSSRYYIEHLIFSLHLHTWGFLALMIGSGYFKLAALGPGWLTTAFWGIFLFWMLWYVLAAFRTIYGQGWTKTAAKLVPLGFSYAIMLVAMSALFFGGSLWMAME